LDSRRGDNSAELDAWGRWFMPKQGPPKQDHWPDRRAFVALIPGAARLWKQGLREGHFILI
jgi:hypothetical protein